MRWVCPRCHQVVSVAFSECPHCPPQTSAPEGESVPRPAPAEEVEVPPPAPPQQRAVTPPAPQPARPAPAPSAAESDEAVATPLVRPESTAAIRSAVVEGRAQAETQETPFWRGVRMGVGFMFAVATILFLLALLMFWLSVVGWQPWFERLLD